MAPPPVDVLLRFYCSRFFLQGWLKLGDNQESFYAREAILEHLEELEDAYLGAERLKTPAKRWTQQELEAGLDLDD